MAGLMSSYLEMMVGRGGHGLIQHFHKGTEENHPKLSLITQSLGQNVNPDPHIFKDEFRQK